MEETNHPLRGVGKVIPPLRMSAEGRTNVIPPEETCVATTVEGVGKVITPPIVSVEGRTNAIPPEMACPAASDSRPRSSGPIADERGDVEGMNPFLDSTEADISRIHLHLGHASINTIMKTAKNAKRKVDEQDIRNAIERCGREQELVKVSQHSQLTPHRAPWDGHTIGMDTWYPALGTGKDHPFIIIVDKFSRMTISGEAMDNSVES